MTEEILSSAPQIDQIDQVSSSEKQKLEGIQDRLQAIIRTVSGKFDLHVRTTLDPATLLGLVARGQDPSTAWFMYRDKKNMYVYIPSTIMERDEEVAKGKAAHEAGHVAITRMGEIVPETMHELLGFHAILAACEERPTDQVVRDRYDGAGAWVDHARRDALKDGEGVVAESIQIPKIKQLASLIVYAPHMETLPAYINPDVAALYEEIRGSIEKMEHTLPVSDAKPLDILNKAKERYAIIYREIWPVASRLVEQDIHDQELEALKDALEKDTGDASDQGETDTQNKNQKEKGKETGGQEKNSNAIGDIVECEGKMGCTMTREQLEEAFSKLNKDERAQLRKIAEEVMKKIEDAIMRAYAANLSDAPLQTHEQYEKKKEKEARHIQQEGARKAEQQKIEKERAELLSQMKKMREMKENNAYEEAYASVQKLDEDLYRRLEDLFIPNTKRNTTLRTSGPRLNLAAVRRWDTAIANGKAPDQNIFERRTTPEKRDYVFSLLVDLSGSMVGERINQTFRAVVLMTEVLNRLGVRFSLYGFNDKLMTFKLFDDVLDDRKRQAVGTMRDSVDGNTNEAPSLAKVSQHLASESGRHKYILVFSDGGPSDGYALSQAVASIMTQTDHRLIGLGVGPDTEHVGHYYPASCPNIGVEELAQKLGELLEDVILHPKTYIGKIPERTDNYYDDYRDYDY